MKPDQRLLPRKVLRTHGVLTSDGNAPRDIRTLDLALGGMSVGIAVQLAIGQRCLVNFEVFLNGKKRNVVATARVIHCVCGGNEGFKAGLQFVEVDEAGAASIAEYMKS